MMKIYYGGSYLVLKRFYCISKHCLKKCLSDVYSFLNTKKSPGCVYVYMCVSVQKIPLSSKSVFIKERVKTLFFRLLTLL